MKRRWISLLTVAGAAPMVTALAVAQTTAPGASAPAPPPAPTMPGRLNPPSPAPRAGAPAPEPPGVPGPTGPAATSPSGPLPAPSRALTPPAPPAATSPSPALPPNPGIGRMPSRPGAITPDSAARAEQVRVVQLALQRQGLDPGPIDGTMTPRTEAALREFQRAHSLAETGQLDGQTLQTLGVPAE